jgi:hypothetical protein
MGIPVVKGLDLCLKRIIMTALLRTECDRANINAEKLMTGSCKNLGKR